MRNKKTGAPADNETPATSIATIPHESQLVNFDPPNQIEFAQKAAKSLMVVIDATKPLVMQGKRYLYFEHWQTIARFFNTTVGVESTTKDANGYIAKAVVYNKDGIVIGGAEASCMNDERNWKGKPDFQLRSMAQTRAMAKALRSMYGFVAVLAGVEATPAEEMNEIREEVNPPYKPNPTYQTPPKSQVKTPIPVNLSLEAELLKMRLEEAKNKDELDIIALDIDFKKSSLTEMEIKKLRTTYALRLTKLNIK